MKYGRGKGYAELAARRVWKLASLSKLEDLFMLTDDEILEIPGVGYKTLKCIRQLQDLDGKTQRHHSPV